MLLASFLFSIMAVCVKLASDYYSTAELVMYRGMIGMAIMFALARMQGGTLRTAYRWQHAWRGLVGVISLWLWFYSFTKLPLATAVTLNYMAPIWLAGIVLTAGWWRGEKRFEWGTVAAIIMSFIGVTVLLRPAAIHADQWVGGLAALASGFISAFAYMQVRRLGQLGEPEYRVVFYFSLACLGAGFLAQLGGSYPINDQATVWHGHGGTGVMLLLVMSVSATAAQLAMTRAYRLGNMLINSNLQYAGIVFSSIWGVLLWSDLLDWLGWLGIAIIISSGSAATFYNARATRRQSIPAAKPVSTPNREI